MGSSLEEQAMISQQGGIINKAQRGLYENTKGLYTRSTVPSLVQKNI